MIFGVFSVVGDYVMDFNGFWGETDFFIDFLKFFNNFQLISPHTPIPFVLLIS